jgi:hypothetical protein
MSSPAALKGGKTAKKYGEESIGDTQLGCDGLVVAGFEPVFLRQETWSV